MRARSLPLIAGTVLAGLGFIGAMGPPLIGPLRETLQAEAGLSRAQLGAGFMGAHLVGCLLGLTLSRVYRGWPRATWFRAGLALIVIGLSLFLIPLRGRAAHAAMALGWLIVSGGLPMAATANGIFADLWDASPHVGVMVLHAVNAGGKVLGPLVALAAGGSLPRSLIGFVAVFGLLAVLSACWPREGVAALAAHERSRVPALRGRGRLWVALCGMQFASIAGAEAGTTAILGSLVAVRRVPAFGFTAPNWASMMVLLMMLSILCGRILFIRLAARWAERRIIAWCLLAGAVGVGPAAWGHSPWLYMPGLILLGLCFSATWPAWFGLLARAWPAERTFLSFAASFGSAVGIALMVGLSSGIGNRPERLPLALAVSVAAMLPFALFALATRRRLA